MCELCKSEKMNVKLRKCRPQDLLRIANCSDYRRVESASILHAKFLQLKRFSHIALASSKSSIEPLVKDVKLCLKLTIKTPERRQYCSGVFYC